MCGDNLVYGGPCYFLMVGITVVQVALLKSVPLRLYANSLIFTKATFDFMLDSMNVSLLNSRL